MTARTNLVKSSLLALGLGAAMAVPAASRAGTISIVYTGGGSSALQGSYSATPSSVFYGVVPDLIITFPGQITGYSPSGYTNYGILYSTVVVKDPHTGFVENGGAALPALVLYAADGTASTSDANLIILIRQDSGYGVRYVANGEQIVAGSWGSFTSFQYTNVPALNTSPPAIESSIESYLSSNVGAAETIYNGLADVAADTVIAFGGFKAGTASGQINTASLSTTKHTLLPVQTISFLYNNSHSTSARLNVTRTMAKSLIGGLPGGDTTTNSPAITWGQVVPAEAGTTLGNNAVDAYFRESSSGTRMTELLNVQRFGPGNKSSATSFVYLEGANAIGGGFYSPSISQAASSGNSTSGIIYGAATGPSVTSNSTGNMIKAVGTDSNGFGYAFLTGNAGQGAGASNVDVATYDGVAPFASTTVPFSFPSSSSSYYTTTVSGLYEIWAYANQYEAQSGGSSVQPVADQIALLLDSALTASELHSLGVTRVSEMQAYRVGFPAIYGSDYVYDGQLITFDAGAFPYNNPNGAGTFTSNAFGGVSNLSQVIE